MKMYSLIYSMVIFLLTLRVSALKPMGRFMNRSEAHDVCNRVCDDLPANDVEPVCMMFSRYKQGYQFYVNECHARRTICKENLLLHMVHPSRCFRSHKFFLPIA